MVKVLITGSTGSIGGATLKSLLAHGHSVTSIVRSEDKGREVAALGEHSSYALIDLKSEHADQIVQLAKAHDVFVHNALQMSEEGVAFEHQLVRAILAAGREQAGEGKPFQFVYTSGCLVLGNTPHAVDESYVGEPLPMLAWRKVLDEEIVAGGNDSFITSVIRPTWVYPGSYVDQWVASAKKLGKIHVFDNLDNYSPQIYLPDLGDFYRLVIERRAQGLFNCTDGTPITLRDMVERVKTETGVTEVETFTNPMPAIGSIGFFAVGQSINGQVISSRASELGWVPTQPTWLNAPLHLE
jgi:nucleoside-diphosphate-sugar epimerase